MRHGNFGYKWKLGYVIDIVKNEAIRIHFKKESYKNNLLIKIGDLEDLISYPLTYTK